MIADSFQEQKSVKLRAQQVDRLASGCLRAAELLEEKREAATKGLVDWHTTMLYNEDRVRKVDTAKLAESERKWNTYVHRLWRVGIEKHAWITAQSKEKDNMRKKAQASISKQLAKAQQKKSDDLKAALDARQAAAADRRERDLRSHYNFLEEAFGPQASHFDAKIHAGNEVDRRDAAWQKNAASWSKLVSTFSDPTLSSSACLKSATPGQEVVRKCACCSTA